MDCNGGSTKASASAIGMSGARRWDRDWPLCPSVMHWMQAALGKGHALGQCSFLQLRQSPRHLTAEAVSCSTESFSPEGGQQSTDSAHYIEEEGAIAFELNLCASW